MTQFDKSISAFNEFTRQLKNCRELKNGNLVARLSVRYSDESFDVKEELEVRFIRTKNDFGKISIEEGKLIHGLNTPTVFTPQLQRYDIVDYTLSILGESAISGSFILYFQQ